MILRLINYPVHPKYWTAHRFVCNWNTMLSEDFPCPQVGLISFFLVKSELRERGDGDISVGSQSQSAMPSANSLSALLDQLRYLPSTKSMMKSLNPKPKLIAMFKHILKVLRLVTMHVDSNLSSQHCNR